MARVCRRKALFSVGAAVVGAPAVLRGRFQLFAQSPAEYSSRAMRVVEETTVVDLLNQFMFAHQTEQPPRIRRWLLQPGSFTAADAAVYESSGINAMAVGLGVGMTFESATSFFAEWNGFFAEYTDRLLRIDSAADFERAKREKKIGVILSTQDSNHFRRPDDVDRFFSLGQRISQLTYNYGNAIGSGFLENRDGGLTVLGHSILSRMQTVGMAVDVSHCADQTTLDTLDAAKQPILFTHAACRTLVPGHLRAKTDEMIRKMAATGGLIGIPFIRFLVRDQEPVELEHVLDHFDHVRKLVGPEYLAIGSDVDILGHAAALPSQPRTPAVTGPSRRDPNFERYREHRDPDYPGAGVRRLDRPMRTFDLVEGLISRGYNDSDITLILGGNAVRVLGNLWSTMSRNA